MPPSLPLPPALRAARGGLSGRRVQTAVIALVVLAATAACTLALGLLTDSNAPFDHAFAAQRGAHVTATVTSSVQLTTSRPAGVTAQAGPFAETTDSVTIPIAGRPGGGPQGVFQTQLTLAGRGSPGGPVDDLTITAGRWASAPGEIVLDRNRPGPAPLLGAKLTVDGAPGSPELTVVGLANSVTSTADGWVTPGEAARLQVPGTPVSAQMLYRFTRAGSYRQVRADVAEVSRALPAGAVAGAASWLSAENAATSNGSIMEPFVVAFALIGLIMAVLIVGNVVSGAVVAGYYRIGVLKSLGLTPGQVVVAYLGRVGWPALGGALAGVVAGQLLALPVLSDSAGAYGVGRQLVEIELRDRAGSSRGAVQVKSNQIVSARAGDTGGMAALAELIGARDCIAFAVFRIAGDAGQLPMLASVSEVCVRFAPAAPDSHDHTVVEGSLSEFDVSTILHTLGSSRQYYMLEIHDEQATAGTIFIKAGIVQSATAGALTGLRAIQHLIA